MRPENLPLDADSCVDVSELKIAQKRGSNLTLRGLFAEFIAESNDSLEVGLDIMR